MNWSIEFIFPRRLHRLSYFFRVLLTNFFGYYLYACGATMNPCLLWMAVIVFMTYQLFFIMLPRMRDIEMNGWWLLALFVPLVNIWLALLLLFRPPALLHPAPKTSHIRALSPRAHR
jgi:hypothetical protein